MQRELPMAYLSYFRFIISHYKDYGKRKMIILPAIKNMSALYAKKLIKKESFEEWLPLFEKFADEVPIAKMKKEVCSYIE